MTLQPTPLSYIIDRDDRIISVGGSWDQFASANGLLLTSVIGANIWEFVAGVDVRHVYELLLRRARSEQTSFDLPFRCDAPSVRREMRMRISPLPDGQVEFRTVTLVEEDREPVALLDSRQPRGSEFLTICGWCGKAQPGKTWVDIELAVAELRLLDGSPVPQLSHGICDRCVAGMETEWAPTL